MTLYRRRVNAVALLRVDPAGKRRQDIGVRLSVLAPGSANLVAEQARFDKAKEHVVQIGGDTVDEDTRFDAGRMALVVDNHVDHGRRDHEWGAAEAQAAATVPGLSYWEPPFDIRVKRSEDGTITKRWKDH